jgi:tRNA dimethylallyltransferase
LPSAEPKGPHLALVGTTASAKSTLALEVARHQGDIELVSIDSMQVYRGMDIGTAKPSLADQAEVPHHLIDLADPHDDYSVRMFQAAAQSAIAAIEDRGHRALLVGGTGLYLRAVIDEFDVPARFPEARAAVEAEPDTAALHRRLTEVDPQAAAKIETGNRRRIVRALEVTLGSGRPFSSYGPGLGDHGPTRFRMAGVWLPRPVVARRIEARVNEMMRAGFLDEVRDLVRRQEGLSPTARQALGYRELIRHVEGELTLDVAVDETVRRTRAFARRQRVWFRRDPRIRWFATGDNPVALLPALLGDWARCRA